MQSSEEKWLNSGNMFSELPLPWAGIDAVCKKVVLFYHFEEMILGCFILIGTYSKAFLSDITIWDVQWRTQMGVTSWHVFSWLSMDFPHSDFMRREGGYQLYEMQRKAYSRGTSFIFKICQLWFPLFCSLCNYLHNEWGDVKCFP